MSGPLTGTSGAAGGSPAARVAGALLADLGAAITAGADTGSERLTLGPRATSVPALDEAAAWARTGFSLRPVGAAATFAQACAAALDVLAGTALGVDGPALLGERAALLGLPPAGSTSAGGSARMVRARDGWVTLQLSRPDDVSLVPALVSDDAAGDPWDLVAGWASERSTAEVADRITLLGLPGGAVGSVPAPRAPWEVTRLPATAGGARSGLVVNLGSLWASPLCAQLLLRAGCRVIDVEGSNRPDGSRLGTPDFYRRVHAGHERAVVDLASPAGRARLASLVAQADVVVTGSRTAALRRLGVVPPADPERDQVWVAITGYGPDSDRVAFGDDAAATGGLVHWTPDGQPRFAGDALADPLTGLAAAVAALAALRAGGSWRIAAALAGVAAYAARL